VVQKGELSLTYGAHGQIAKAEKPGLTLEYVYDENSLRILKKVNGAPKMAWAGGGILTESAFVEVVEVGGVTMGVIQNGVFTAMLTDPRGTALTTPNGADYAASPYGMRLSYDELSELLDYAKLGHDKDLGVVRMGVRDYDPALSQFWQPDPAFLESLEKCQGSPIECSLYGYARNNPISFTDPTGMTGEKIPFGSNGSSAANSCPVPAGLTAPTGPPLPEAGAGSTRYLQPGDHVKPFPLETGNGSSDGLISPNHHDQIGEQASDRVSSTRVWMPNGKAGSTLRTLPAVNQKQISEYLDNAHKNGYSGDMTVGGDSKGSVTASLELWDPVYVGAEDSTKVSVEKGSESQKTRGETTKSESKGSGEAGMGIEAGPLKVNLGGGAENSGSTEGTNSKTDGSSGKAAYEYTGQRGIYRGNLMLVLSYKGFRIEIPAGRATVRHGF
jgi:RHS repeat-associated protein